MLNIGIIGAGGVGSTAAFALIMRGVARKVVLIDQNAKRAEAEAEDIAHATPLPMPTKSKPALIKTWKTPTSSSLPPAPTRNPAKPSTTFWPPTSKFLKASFPSWRNMRRTPFW